MAENPISAQSISRRKKVEARTGLSRSTIYQRIKDGTFPPPISLGAKAVGWLDSDIDEWIAERVKSSRSAKPEIA